MSHDDFKEILDSIDRDLRDYYEYSIWKSSDPEIIKKKISTLDCFVNEAFGPEARGGSLEFMDAEGLSCIVLCEKQHVSDTVINRVARYYTPTTNDTFRPRELMEPDSSHTNYTGVNNSLQHFLEGGYIPNQSEVSYSILTSGIFLCQVAPNIIDKSNISLQLIHDTVRFGVLMPFLFSTGRATENFMDLYSHIAALTGKTRWDEGDSDHTLTYLKKITSSQALKHWCIFVVLPFDCFDTIRQLATGLHPYIKRIIQIEEYPALLKDRIFIANNDLDIIKTEIALSSLYGKDKDFLEFHRDFLLKYIDSHIISRNEVNSHVK